MLKYVNNSVPDKYWFQYLNSGHLPLQSTDPILLFFFPQMYDLYI